MRTLQSSLQLEYRATASTDDLIAEQSGRALFDGTDIIVRGYLPVDRDAFTELVTDARAMAPLGGVSSDPAALFARVLESAAPDERAWAVFRRSSERYIGHIFISRTSLVPDPELGFVFSPSCWGQGLARQAVVGLVRILQRGAPGLCLSATVDLDNPAAQRVLHAAGFSRRAMQHDERGPYLVFALGVRPSARQPASG